MDFEIRSGYIGPIYVIYAPSIISPSPLVI